MDKKLAPSTASLQNFPSHLPPEGPMKSTQGQFVWYDLITTDVDAAVAFYKSAIGWTTQMWAGTPYIMFANKDVPLGGVVSTGKDMGNEPYWLPYVTVDDVDVAAGKVTELGGTITSGPKDIPGSGRYAIITDPLGASIAIYKSSSPSTGLEVKPGIGQFSWHDLSTSDYKAALDFYGKIFGWKALTAHDMGPLGVYQMYGIDSEIGGMANSVGDTAKPTWLCYIMVESVRKTIERVEQAGGKLTMGPHQVPTGDWIANCRDPQGAAFAIQSNGA